MARGTDANFDQITAMLLDNAKKFEAQTIKWVKYSDVLDACFSQFGWDKKSYYDELNRRLGIVTNEMRRDDKAARVAAAPKAKTVKEEAKGLIGNNQWHVCRFCHAHVSDVFYTQHMREAHGR